MCWMTAASFIQVRRASWWPTMHAFGHSRGRARSNGRASRAWRLRALLPGLEGANLPFALVGAAGLTLHPRRASFALEAREEFVAGQSVLAAGRRDRRHRAARPGLGILPRDAGILAALAHDLADRRPRDDEIAFRRQIGDRLDGRLGGLLQRAGHALALLFPEQLVEPRGKRPCA